jgi:hypothetical protein
MGAVVGSRRWSMVYTAVGAERVSDWTAEWLGFELSWGELVRAYFIFFG